MEQGGTQVPSYGSELGTRIEKVAKRVGGKRKLASLIGVHEVQVHRYIRGENVPALDLAVKIAVVGNVSLVWLATGEGEMEPGLPSPEKLNLERLDTAVRVVEDYLEENGLAMRSEKKAQAIVMLYERFIDWEGSPDALRRLMKLAS